MFLLLRKGSSCILNGVVEGSFFSEGIHKIYNHIESAWDCWADKWILDPLNVSIIYAVCCKL